MGHAVHRPEEEPNKLVRKSSVPPCPLCISQQKHLSWVICSAHNVPSTGRPLWYLTLDSSPLLDFKSEVSNCTFATYSKHMGNQLGVWNDGNYFK